MAGRWCAPMAARDCNASSCRACAACLPTRCVARGSTRGTWSRSPTPTRCVCVRVCAHASVRVCMFASALARGSVCLYCPSVCVRVCVCHVAVNSESRNADVRLSCLPLSRPKPTVAKLVHNSVHTGIAAYLADALSVASRVRHKVCSPPNAPTQVEFVVSFLGATYARAVAVPLNAAYKAVRVAMRVAACSALRAVCVCAGPPCTTVLTSVTCVAPFANWHHHQCFLSASSARHRRHPWPCGQRIATPQ